MGRTPNIKVNMELLDKHIREKEGGNFNQNKVSKFVMGKGSTYYCEAIKSGTLNPEVLDRVCEYYEFTKEDYLVTDETKKVQIQKQADTMNYENVILLLTGIDKTLKELLAQQKSTNYSLNELRNAVFNTNKNSKDILEKLENIEKRGSRHVNKFTN